MENLLTQTVSKAIIPAAGFGTRLYPVTKAIPKEMLPIGRKPVLEYIIEELVIAGLSNILLIISSQKEMIRSYFQNGAAWGARIEYKIQKDMRGSGHAVLLGEDWTNGQPFVVDWGDSIFRTKKTDSSSSNVSPLKRLIGTFVAQHPGAAVLTKRVEKIKPDKYHIVRYFFIPASSISGIKKYQQPFPISTILKNPKAELIIPILFSASSRWLLSSEVFYYLKKLCAESQEEILLTESVYNLFANGGTVWGVPLDKNELIDDIGSWESYLSVITQEAVRDLEYGKTILKNLLGSLG